MRQNCCAYNCKQKTGQGVSFHSFPKGKALREKWIFNMRWANWKPGVSSKICDHHFEPDCFLRTPWSKRKTLKPKAVPTIFNFPDKGNKSTPRKPPKDRNSTQKTFEQQNQITSQPVGNIFIETNDTELENIMVMPDIHFTPASSPLSNCSPSPQLPEQEIKPKIETIQNTTPKIESIQNIILETPNTTLENVFIVPDIVSPEFSPLSIPNPSSSTHESKDSKIICIDDFDENNIWHYSTDVLIPLVKAIKYSNAKKDHEINMLKERLRLQEKKIEYLNSMIKHLTGGTE